MQQSRPAVMCVYFPRPAWSKMEDWSLLRRKGDALDARPRAKR